MMRLCKHSNPRKTTIYVAYLILKRLRKNRIANLSELYLWIISRVSGADFLFVPALNFLYVVGKIEYHAKGDFIEYCKNETE